MSAHTYGYARPAVTVDCVIVGSDGAQLQVLLIERAHPPCAGSWALPGGFVDADEPLASAAAREVQEETGVSSLRVEQLQAFGDPGRDPRGWTVSIAFLALVDSRRLRPAAASDARRVAWHSLGRPPALAFDHAAILAAARARLVELAHLQPLGRELLPRTFLMRDLHAIYAGVLGAVDRSRLQRRAVALGAIVDTGKVRRGATGRAEKLYRFDARRVRALGALQQGLVQ